MRWIFAEDGSAIQACHVTRIFYDYDVTRKAYTVKVSIPGPAHPFTVFRYDTQSQAEEAIKDLVVGRNHRRA